MAVEVSDDLKREVGSGRLDDQMIARLGAQLGDRVMRDVDGFHPNDLTTKTRLGGAARRSRMDTER